MTTTMTRERCVDRMDDALAVLQDATRRGDRETAEFAVGELARWITAWERAPW